MSDGEQEQKRLGAGMFALAWLALMGLMVAWFNGTLDSQRNPNQSLSTAYTDGAREVVLQRNRYGHYVSSGQINGREVEFMLDTGATTIAIPSDIARKLNLEMGRRFQTRTANGVGTAYATTLSEVSVGGITLHNVEAAITPGLSGQILLGMSFLQKIEFAQRGDTMILRQYQGSAN